MTALAVGLPLTLAIVLAFVAWRDWLDLHKPLPPHEELKTKVQALDERVGMVEKWARIGHG